MKGQLAIYKVEGLLEAQEFINRQNSENPFVNAKDNLLGNINPKHCKTLEGPGETGIMLKIMARVDAICCNVRFVLYAPARHSVLQVKRRRPKRIVG